MIIKFLLGIVLCELITELIIKSELFEPLTNIFKSRRGKNWFFWYTGGLLSCGYCFSVYVGTAMALLLNLSLFDGFIFSNSGLTYIINLVFSGLLLHRGSNILHNVVDKYTNKYYDLRFRKSDDLLIIEENDDNG